MLVQLDDLARPVVETVRHESQVTFRITTVMSRPMMGSPTGAPSATTIALATTPSETNPSTRAWLPSAINAGLDKRFPARRRTCAASSLPTKPTSPAAASTQRCESSCGWMSRSIDSYRATQAETKIASTTAKPRDLLGSKRTKEERDPDRHRGERVPDVVDQVGEQRHRARQNESPGLHERRGAQDSEADRDRLEPGARAQDGTVYETVRAPVLAVMVMPVLMVVGATLDRLRALNEPEMPVRASVGVLVDSASVAMQCRCPRTGHGADTVAWCRAPAR